MVIYQIEEKLKMYGLSRTHLGTLLSKTDKALVEELSEDSPLSYALVDVVQNPFKFLKLLEEGKSSLPPNVYKRAKRKLQECINTEVGSTFQGSVFVKQVKSNELGYRNGKPNQAGTFILIPKNCVDLFPRLSADYENDDTTINVMLANINSPKECHFIYHNSKIARNEEHGRDEYRLYITEIKEELQVVPDDIVVIVKDPGSKLYYIYKYTEGVKAYDLLLELIIKYKVGRSYACMLPISELVLNDIKIDAELLANYVNDEEDASDLGIYEGKQINMESGNKLEEDYRNRLPEEVMQELASQMLQDDIPYTLSKIKKIKRDSRFRKAILSIYDNKCSITGEKIQYGKYNNLQACHIIGKNQGGTDNPSNGIALDMNLHWAFDMGMFTINNQYEVVVHPEMRSLGYLAKFHGCRINLPQNKEFYPSLEALKYHKENIYGNFCK